MSHRLLLKELSRYKIGTFADIIYRNALLYADKDAFIFGKKRTTFSEYNARVNKVVRALQGMGVKKGDVIGILSWNSLEYADLYGAAMKGGFIASPFSPRLKADELNYIINYSEANTLFVGPELLGMAKSLKANLPKVKNYIALESTDPDMKAYGDLLEANSGEEPEVLINEDDPATLIYTSGTTGVPRGALHNHRGMVDDSRTLIIDTGIRPTDKHIQLTPLFHIGGYTFFRAFLYIGATNVILRNFDPAATLKTIQKEKATHINLVPTHLIAMLALPDIDKYKLDSLKVMWYGGSPIPVKVLKKAVQTFGPILSQGYGQSESGPAMTHLSIEEHDVLNMPEAEQKKLFSAGRPDIGVHVRIVDEVGQDVEPGESGEIIVSSKHNMVEYWRKPEDTKANLVDGWLHTGDIGYYDEQGYIYITDRKKDMIKSGGEDVFPREVEELLYKHPAVAEAQVFGVPDPYWIERVHAVVMIKEGSKCSAEELIAFCKERIAGYKVPKSLEFVTDFPKTPSGKILKKNIREKYWAGLPRRV